MSLNEILRSSNDEKLSDVIDKLLRAYGFEKKLKEIDVINAWEEMMGKAVAYRTKSIKINNEVLYVSMESSVLRDELQHGKQVIIERVNQKAGFQMIRDVWFG